MSSKRLQIKNAIYHIMARGNHKENVFKDKPDYEFYLFQLRRYKRKHSFFLYGYCLMPNHVHLIGSFAEPEKISKFVQGLQLSYTLYYNKRYSKVGHLWQGRFKNMVIHKDEYLINVISYVELNPVKAKIVIDPAEYLFSSYCERVFGTPRIVKLLDDLSM